MKSLHPLLKLVLIIGIAGGILCLIPLKVPFSISTHGKIYHGQEWVLAKDDVGRIGTFLYDRVSGRIDSYRLHRFENPDAVRFQLHGSIIPGAAVQKGDTVGSIYSAQLERELVSLKGELALARASLRLHRTGEKEADVDEAKNRLRFARQRVEGQSAIIDRMRLLHERDLISDEELEIAINEGKLYEVEIAIAEAHLQSIETGAKAEQIEYFETMIATLENDIAALRRVSDDYVFTAPIDGMIYKVFARDTLAIIGDTSAYVSVIPVPLRYKEYIAIGDNITVRVPGTNTRSYNATVHSIGNTAVVMNGAQYFTINAIVADEEANYVPGVMVNARIRTEPVTFREYLLRYIRPILR